MKKVFAFIILVIVIIGIILVKKQSLNNTNNVLSEITTEQNITNTINNVSTVDQAIVDSSNTTNSEVVVTNTASTNNFTLDQVATHNTEADCYSAINGNVYNLTAWINKHPGGDRAILSICGKDGSSAFNGKHGGDTKPEQILAGFEVGTLVQ